MKIDYLSLIILLIAMITARIESIDPKVKIPIGSCKSVNGNVESAFNQEMAIIWKQNEHKPNTNTKFAIFPIFSILSYIFNQIKLFKNIVKKLPWQKLRIILGELMNSKKTHDYLQYYWFFSLVLIIPAIAIKITARHNEPILIDSWSSVKRAKKALMAHNIITIISNGFLNVSDSFSTLLPFFRTFFLFINTSFMGGFSN